MGSRHLTLGGANAPYIDQGVRDGTSAFGPSDLTTSAADSRPARIFIVEDDPVMLRMVADYLEQHNMHAVPASGRQEMMRYFTANEPDLVILRSAARTRGRLRPAARDQVALRCSNYHYHR
jgi:hypothetical protein